MTLMTLLRPAPTNIAARVMNSRTIRFMAFFFFSSFFRMRKNIVVIPFLLYVFFLVQKEGVADGVDFRRVPPTRFLIL